MPRISHSEEMRKKILDAFGSCLMKNPVSSISVRDIAAAAEVPLGSIHYYFHNKTEILLSYFEGVMESCTAVIHEWRMKLPEEISSFPEFFTHYAELTRRCFQEDEITIRYTRYYALLLDSPELCELCRVSINRYAEELAAAIRQTRLPCDNPLRLAQFLVSLWDGVSLHAELFVDGADHYKLFNTFADMICKDKQR